MTVAHLGFKIDSSEVKKAVDDLKALAPASAQAEQATEKLTNASKHAAAALSGMTGANNNGSAAARAAAAALNIEATAATRAAAALMQTSNAAKLAANNQRMMMFQLNDIGTMLAMGASPFQILASQGGQIAQIYAGQGGVRAALDDTVGALGRAARAHPMMAAAAVAAGAAIAGLTYEINQASDVTVGFGDTALAVFQVIGDGIYTLLKPAIDAIAPWFASAWDLVVQGVKVAGNTFIGLWIAQVEAVKFAVNSIPDAFIVAGEAAANGFLGAIDWMVNKALSGIQALMDGVNDFINSVGGDRLRDLLGWSKDTPQLYDPKKPFTVGTAQLGGNAARDRLSAGWGGMKDAMSAGFGTDWMGGAFDLVQAKAIENALSKVEEATKKTGEAAKSAGNGWKRFGDEARRAAEETIRTAQAMANDFVADLRSGLQAGEGFWRSFANAAMNALDNITSKLMEMATNSLVANAMASLFGGQFLSPRAWGAIQAGTAPATYATGGMVHGPGTGTSDSIVARLSKGEFVVRAAAVAQPGVRSLLENINGYADGGLVRDPGVCAGQPGGFGEKLAA